MKRTRELVAFQGERGAFSQQAVRNLLGERADVLPCQRFEDLFTRLRDKKVTAAVVPIENTLAAPRPTAGSTTASSPAPASGFGISGGSSPIPSR